MNAQRNLEKMEQFFELDLKIKDLIVKMKPQLFNSDQYYMMKYVDNLLEELDNIRRYLCSITDMLYLFEITQMIRDKFEEYKNQIINCNYSYERLQRVYENCFLNMTPGLEKTLSENFFGMSIDRSEDVVFSKCNTINDLLHALHFYMVNNEECYERMPVLDKKTNFRDLDITLFGKDNELSRELFINFPKNLDVDETDILSFDDRILIIVRGRGHALSFDIEKEEDDKYRVSYFIPKVCNVEKANKLKGVTKLDPNNSTPFSFTNGEFVVNRNDFSKNLFSFIDSVPTDGDMEIVKRGMNGFM